MAVSPASIGRRYSALVVLVAAQLLLVVVSPSTPPKSSQVAAGSNSGPIAAGANADNGTANGAVDASGNPVAAGGSAGGGAANGATATGGGAAGGGGGGTGAAAGSGGAAGGGGATGAVDRSKCGPDGKQIGPTFYMPPCVPVWHGGDNGGSTMTGVTPTEIHYLYYAAQGNAEVNAILAREDLAASADQLCGALKAFDTEINKRWEFYGRKAIPMDGPGNHAGSAQGSNCKTAYYQGQCSLTPPAPDCERAEADQIAAMKPAMVIAPTADPALYNQLGKDHIIVWGGEDEPDSYHQSVAPYYWDVFRNNNRIADMLAEYYCKKLVNKPPAFAGTDVTGNPTFPKQRKVAILFPATNGDPTSKIGADEFVKQLSGGMCNSPGGVKEYEYQSDITTAEQQSNTIVAGLISDHITTVVCLCDPIAPVFLTNTMNGNRYHPEHLMTGSGLLDYDALAQLYEKSEWDHAFGLSELTDAIPFEQSDAVKAWQDSGTPGTPDKTENLNWAYFSAMATAFQDAGPKLTPASFRDGLFKAAAQGGDHFHALIAFGHPNDYTGIKDAREVWYCSTTTSPINGNAGAYVSVDGGRRRQLGEQPAGDPAVFPHGFCS